MKERFSFLFSLFIMLLLVIGTWWAADYTQRAVEIDPPSKATHEPDTWAKHFVLVRTSETGMTINRLEGDYLEHFPDNKSYEIQYPRAYGIRPDKPVMVGTSKLGVVFDEGKRIVLKGDAVLLRVGDNDNVPLNFSSQEIIMLPDEEITYTDLRGVAVSGRHTMTGVGMRYNNATQQLEVSKDTDVVVAPRDDRKR